MSWAREGTPAAAIIARRIEHCRLIRDEGLLLGEERRRNRRGQARSEGTDGQPMCGGIHPVVDGWGAGAGAHGPRGEMAAVLAWGG